MSDTMSDAGTTNPDVPAALATQVYVIFIRATPEAIFEAITTPEFSRRYFHGAHIDISAVTVCRPDPDRPLSTAEPAALPQPG